MKITYTFTDEAPALATYSLLPIIRAFAETAGVEVETSDISLASRILAQFNDVLPPEQRVPDALAELGELVLTPEANIIKLPNISASVPQLKAAVEELRKGGYDLPDYPDDDSTPEAEDALERYGHALGSAVNPVLRQGNSDRRAPAAVKEYARRHPHSMGEWSPDSKTHVATMSEGDFRSSEQSVTLDRATEVRIELETTDGQTIALKEALALEEGEILDAAVMSRRALCDFLAEQVADAKAKGVLFSIHLKATMMKVSDPIIFGHAVRTYFADVFDKHADTFARLGVNPNYGLGALLSALQELPEDERAAIERDLEAALEAGPDVAMVDSDRGITNFHVPSDIIVDASMPAMIRTSGQMWNAAGEQQDAKAVIPDSSYAALYDETIRFCQAHGAFDPATMGTVPNVGLMAQKAEEYGSHDKTFEIPAAGTVRVVDDRGTVLLEHTVEEGDIWRACQTKDAPVRDWVKLAVTRARAGNMPAVFWLDETRAHDREVLAKVREALQEHDTSGLQIEVMPVAEATRFTLERAKAGQDTLSVTGNVLRDYLTDLFPILELGTSAKMLSAVPQLAGGAMFETGAGGSAPKHVQQFLKEGHLRWDSLGEFLALGASFEHLADVSDNAGARVMADAIDRAVARFLEEGRSPSRKVNEIDTRGSHYYFALYWAQALAEQTSDPELRDRFAPLAQRLADEEATITRELLDAQGSPQDIGGYYWPDPEKASAAMRPSATLNAALASL